MAVVSYTHRDAIRDMQKAGVLTPQEAAIKLIETEIVAGKHTSPPAIKHDANKLDWSLIPWDSLEEILKVLEFGKIKYSSWNWSSGEGFKYSRIFNSLVRHLFAWIRGEDNDPESGISHLAHAGCNILFLIYFVRNKSRYPNNDDRHVV